MNNEQNQEELLSQHQKQLQLLKQVEILEKTVKQHLSREAITRYGNLKTAHPEKAMQVLLILAQLIEAKRITGILSDKEFKDILIQLQQPKKEFKMNIIK